MTERGRTRVLIAGGGIGGLALAHALRRGGLRVAAYEKDPEPTVRNQGYRIHLDADGNAALRACLPADVLEAVRSTSGIQNDWLGAYTDQLHQIMGQTFPLDSGDEITHVDRNTFRHGLLNGLRDIVSFDRTVTGYEITDSGMLAADRGERPLVDAIAAYERVMLPRGFANIDQSLRNAEMMFPRSLTAPMS